ncbi:DUF2141 domain-containing protein [Hymenobacter sp. HD11105]|jgi:uncharacterized protein (DUF2141 family)
MLLHIAVFTSAIFGGSLTDSDTPAAGTIVGTVTNLRSARGICFVSLYDRKEGFPGKTAVATQKVKLTAKECTFVFEKLPKGDYAIAAYHDENNNGRLDTNLIGIPTEGYAFSNNPRTTMGPPSFAEAKVMVHHKRVQINLAMKY